MDKFDTAYNALEAAIINQESSRVLLDLLRKIGAAHVTTDEPVRHIGDATT